MSHCHLSCLYQGPGESLYYFASLVLCLVCPRALESLKIMDYSLLVGIHNIDQAAGRKGPGSIMTAGGEESWAGPISWDPEEGGRDHQQRRPAMLERIGTLFRGIQ